MSTKRSLNLADVIYSAATKSSYTPTQALSQRSWLWVLPLLPLRRSKKNGKNHIIGGGIFLSEKLTPHTHYFHFLLTAVWKQPPPDSGEFFHWLPLTSQQHNRNRSFLNSINLSKLEVCKRKKREKEKYIDNVVTRSLGCKHSRLCFCSQGSCFHNTIQCKWHRLHLAQKMKVKTHLSRKIITV
jgi:hypothetical protein